MHYYLSEAFGLIFGVVCEMLVLGQIRARELANISVPNCSTAYRKKWGIYGE